MTLNRWLLSLLALVLTATPASAHFLWVVPDMMGGTARVIVSESLEVAQRVDIAIVSGAALVWRGPDGTETPVALTRTGQVFTVTLPGPRGVVHGQADLGTRPSGERVYRLFYYPKTIVGSPYDVALTGKPTPIEIVPVGSAGATRLKVLLAGKATAGIDVNVLLPDGSEETVQTGADGMTEPLAGRGRYGAWARQMEPIGGTVNGKAFEQTRHYTMLVFDTEGGATPHTSASPKGAVATKVATLPEAASSFGAVANDGWLYVYGGHVVPTHTYSTAAVSGQFHRLKLSDLTTWETLPSGPPLQGMNLATFNRKVFRVGGMQPRNAPGEKQDIASVADVARFDPATGAWDTLPPLPMPISSHDVAVVGQQLFVIGGWSLKSGARTEWPTTMAVLDLSSKKPEWKTLPQPFARRAFITAALDDKIFVLGGFDETSAVLRGTSIYDAARGTWSEGPKLPGGMMNGFGPAAAVVNGRLIISVDNGGVYRLNAAATGWDEIGRATPRIVHRLVAAGNDVLVIGGTGDDDNSNLVERLPIR